MEDKAKEFCSIDEYGAQMKPFPQRLVDICRKALEAGEPLEQIQQKIGSFCDYFGEQIKGSGRRGILNATIIDHLACCSTVPPELRETKDPTKCMLDLMSDEEVNKYLTKTESMISSITNATCNFVNWQDYKRSLRAEFEDDKRYLRFMGRIV